MANAGGRPHVLVALVLVILGGRVDASTMVNVYRAIQYDISGAPFGSRVASLNHYAVSSLSSDLSLRTALILSLRELNRTFIKEYIEHGKPLGGLLLLLPEPFRYRLPTRCSHTHERKQLAYLEQKLIHSTIQYPVYFAYEDGVLDKVLADIRRNDAAGRLATAAFGGYKLIVTSLAPKKLAPPAIINIQGWLPGFKAYGDSTQLPTIAIVASYDTFGAAPALSVGSDSNGGSVVALMYLARLFSVLYNNPKTRGRYNILFGLTSGGPYNYIGTQKWLRSFDQRLLKSIDYAICLNSISLGKDELWLHVSKLPANAYVKQIFEGLSNVAKEMDFEIGIKHKEINVSNSRVAWEHEQFSRLGVTAATLSGLSVAPDLLENTGGISDKREFVDGETVVKVVKLVAESLARHIYGQEGNVINMLADKSRLLASYRYIVSWLDYLSKAPRVAPFLSNDSAFIGALKKELADHVVEMNLQQDVIDGMFTFYDSTVDTLQIYQVGFETFDLPTLFVLGSYLITLFSLLVIAGLLVCKHFRVWMISLFHRPTSRKVRATRH